ncbi:MAG: hypothetical protein COB67_10955 [SAR324 cluster bacterium]|uniref:Uncharacterized protein n=1 Tax=SAR324 cluster bacterium TaxID=2024889 RepID=A0A2A4SWI9_9DELT|nr:MAG: hypothetical protein COB67_10955 [SAR324 cluster bacterium]
MKRILWISFFFFFTLHWGGLLAQNGEDVLLDPELQVKETQGKRIDSIKIVNARKVILSPGNIQRIKTGEEGETILGIEFEHLDPMGDFPVVRIQGIPFKLTKRGESIKFTWQQASYELVWLPQGDKVSLLSSEPFGERTFSPKAQQVKRELLYKGLAVETKRMNGVHAKMEVTGIVKNREGKMEKFSVRTFSNKARVKSYQNENNIIAPAFQDQYEKGVNGEVLFIFSTNKQGQIYVYYR